MAFEGQVHIQSRGSSQKIDSTSEPAMEVHPPLGCSLAEYKSTPASLCCFASLEITPIPTLNYHSWCSISHFFGQVLFPVSVPTIYLPPFILIIELSSMILLLFPQLPFTLLLSGFRPHHWTGTAHPKVTNSLLIPTFNNFISIFLSFNITAALDLVL